MIKPRRQEYIRLKHRKNSLIREFDSEGYTYALEEYCEWLEKERKSLYNEDRKSRGVDNTLEINDYQFALNQLETACDDLDFDVSYQLKVLQELIDEYILVDIPLEDTDINEGMYVYLPYEHEIVYVTGFNGNDYEIKGYGLFESKETYFTYVRGEVYQIKLPNTVSII